MATCTICTRSDRNAIDKAIVEKNGSLRRIAERFGTSPQTLLRHRPHVSERLAKAQEAAEVADADSLLEQVKNLQAKAISILAKAEEAGDLRAALGAIRESRGCLELLGKLMGELEERQHVSVEGYSRGPVIFIPAESDD